MWWKAKGDEENKLKALLGRLESRFVEQVKSEFVLGVGALFDYRRYKLPLVPLLLVNGVGTDMLNHILRESELPETMRIELKAWELPAESRFFFVTPPELASYQAAIPATPGAAIRCQLTGDQATLGVALANNLPPSQASHPKAFLTAGHFTQTGSVIELVSRRHPAIGTVSYTQDPRRNPGQPGYDVAVVDIHPHIILSQPAHAGVAHIQSPINVPLPCTLQCPAGRIRQAGIVGSLNAYGSAVGVWKNSWLVLPSGIIRKGDSGGTLISCQTNEVVGMVVGGSRFPNSGSYMAQYAHDMASVETDILIGQGYSIV